MPDLADFRSGKPDFYPDQSVYAEFACSKFGLAFDDLDDGTGLVFKVASPAASIHFGAGRCSWYPQNNATASTLASDKYFTNRILERAGIATLGGEYFFLHGRHRAHRPAGHEREDASVYFRKLGTTAFVKPLTGSRGDFAQMVDSEAGLSRYFDQVGKYYDSIVMQPFVSGIEYRVFLLGDELLYTARKHPPFVIGDGVRTLRTLLRRHDEALRVRGLSPVSLTDGSDASLSSVLKASERRDIPGRMNLSAGGTMVLESINSDAVITLAKRAVQTLGLHVAAVDLFTDIDGDAEAARIIEVNSNPSIRLLEQSGREDLILKIWHHTFSTIGLI